MKVAVIGGGSTYTPELVNGFLTRHDRFPMDELWLMDVDPARLASGWDRDRIMDAINAEGVFCQSGSCSEIYLEKAFPPAMRPPQRLPVARELGENSLAFLAHPTLSEQDMADTARAVQKVMAVAAGS
jgi:dTDP-4-amino-4,6-dideoxygalactose transaminase